MRLIKSLCALFLCAGAAWAQTVALTPNIDLNEPTAGTLNWGAYVNQNWLTLDDILSAVGKPGGLRLLSGAGIPAGVCINGSIYFRTTGAIGSTFYYCENTAWRSESQVSGTGSGFIAQGCDLGGFFNQVDGAGAFTCDFPVFNFYHNGILVGIEEGANMVDSATVTWTATDDPLNNRVNYSIASEPVDIGVTFNGVFDSGYTVIRHPFPFAVTVPAGCTHSILILDVATTGTLIFSLTKNGVEFGTATFGAGGTSATFSCATATVFAEGDVLRATATGTDATASDLGGTIYGTR